MQLVLKALIIDKSPDSLDKLEAALAPDVSFEYLDVVNTVHKAIEYHMDMEFDLCLIAHDFPDSEVKSFFTDFAKLEKKEPCVFIQFRKTCEPDLDRESLQSIGFASIISTVGDHKDKEYLWKAIRPLLHKRKFAEAVGELDTVVEKLLTEVDLMAAEHRRGKKKKFNNVVSRYLKDTSDEFDKIKDAYVDKLLKGTESSSAFEPVKVEIPDQILNKKLPHLHKDGYKGQSHRVSAKVQDLHGDSVGKPRKSEPLQAVSTPEEEETAIESPPETEPKEE